MFHSYLDSIPLQLVAWHTSTVPRQPVSAVFWKKQIKCSLSGLGTLSSGWHLLGIEVPFLEKANAVAKGAFAWQISPP